MTTSSRSGKPPRGVAHHDAHWLAKVQWQSADLFDPSTYKHHLVDAHTVVHSVGILLENQNYKAAVNSNSSVLSEFVNFVKPSNPLVKIPRNTYSEVNRDSALLLAETYVAETKVDSPSFVYISADRGFPGLPSGYITSKREAEVELSLLKGLKCLFARPGFMFDEDVHDDTMRETIHKFVDVLDWGNRTLLGSRIPLLNDLVRPTISTQTVAHEIVDHIKNDKFNGVLSLDEMLHK